MFNSHFLQKQQKMLKSHFLQKQQETFNSQKQQEMLNPHFLQVQQERLNSHFLQVQQQQQQHGQTQQSGEENSSSSSAMASLVWREIVFFSLIIKLLLAERFIKACSSLTLDKCWFFAPALQIKQSNKTSITSTTLVTFEGSSSLTDFTSSVITFCQSNS